MMGVFFFKYESFGGFPLMFNEHEPGGRAFARRHAAGMKGIRGNPQKNVLNLVLRWEILRNYESSLAVEIRRSLLRGRLYRLFRRIPPWAGLVQHQTGGLFESGDVRLFGGFVAGGEHPRNGANALRTKPLLLCPFFWCLCESSFSLPFLGLILALS